jgi:tripeptidyl-peptidase-1
VVHEKRNALPVAWTKHSRAPKDTILPVRIGLTQRNLEHSDRFLDDISDPESPNFGKKTLAASSSSAEWMTRKALEC